MPYVNIKITREIATKEQKARLVRGVTALLSEVLGEDLETTLVVIDEIYSENWGVDGETAHIVRSPVKQREKRAPKRGLPENLIRYQEERRRAKLQQATSDFDILIKEGDPARGDNENDLEE